MTTMVYGFDIETPDGRAAAQHIEYSTYIAVADISFGDEVLAFNVNDAVPISAVHAQHLGVDQVLLIGVDPLA
jgi:hypothetical protein